MAADRLLWESGSPPATKVEGKFGKISRAEDMTLLEFSHTPFVVQSTDLLPPLCRLDGRGVQGPSQGFRPRRPTILARYAPRSLALADEFKCCS